MQLQAVVTAIGKRKSVFKNEAGESITSYTGNASQNNGEIITEVRLSKDFYLNRELAETKEQEQKNLSTLRAVYPLWLKLKGLETNASTYIRRIDTDWKKYYLDDPIIDMDMRTFTKAQLKEWALTAIRKNGLTKTQYYNMSVIIRQALDYAADHGLIEANPYNQFTVEAKLFKKVKKPDDCTQVFLKTERPLIEAEAWHEFDDKGCTTALAVPLAFQIGVRLGELVAIKDTDICGNGKYLHIQRMAQRLTGRDVVSRHLADCGTRKDLRW